MHNAPARSVGIAVRQGGGRSMGTGTVLRNGQPIWADSWPDISQNDCALKRSLLTSTRAG